MTKGKRPKAPVRYQYIGWGVNWGTEPPGRWFDVTCLMLWVSIPIVVGVVAFLLR